MLSILKKRVLTLLLSGLLAFALVIGLSILIGVEQTEAAYLTGANADLDYAGYNNGGVWTDYGGAAADIVTDDFAICGATANDAAYYGMKYIFDQLVIKYDTLCGAGHAGAWEYYDGDSWEALTVTDNSNGFEAVVGTYTVTITAIPTNWATVDPDGAGVVFTTAGYFIRFRTTTGDADVVGGSQASAREFNLKVKVTDELNAPITTLAAAAFVIADGTDNDELSFRETGEGIYELALHTSGLDVNYNYTVVKDGYVTSSTVATGDMTTTLVDKSGTPSALNFAYKATAASAFWTEGPVVAVTPTALTMGNAVGQIACALSGAFWYCPVPLANSLGALLATPTIAGYVQESYSVLNATSRTNNAHVQNGPGGDVPLISAIKFAYKVYAYSSGGGTSIPVTTGIKLYANIDGVWTEVFQCPDTNYFYLPIKITDDNTLLKVLYNGQISFWNIESQYQRSANTDPQSTFNVMIDAGGGGTGATSCSVLPPTSFDASYEVATKAVKLTWKDSANAEWYDLYLEVNYGGIAGAPTAKIVKGIQGFTFDPFNQAGLITSIKPKDELSFYNVARAANCTDAQPVLAITAIPESGSSGQSGGSTSDFGDGTPQDLPDVGIINGPDIAEDTEQTPTDTTSVTEDAPQTKDADLTIKLNPNFPSDSTVVIRAGDPVELLGFSFEIGESTETVTSLTIEEINAFKSLDPKSIQVFVNGILVSLSPNFASDDTVILNINIPVLPNMLVPISISANISERAVSGSTTSIELLDLATASDYRISGTPIRGPEIIIADANDLIVNPVTSPTYYASAANPQVKVAEMKFAAGDKAVSVNGITITNNGSADLSGAWLKLLDMNGEEIGSAPYSEIEKHFMFSLTPDPQNPKPPVIKPKDAMTLVVLLDIANLANKNNIGRTIRLAIEKPGDIQINQTPAQPAAKPTEDTTRWHGVRFANFSFAEADTTIKEPSINVIGVFPIVGNTITIVSSSGLTVTRPTESLTNPPRGFIYGFNFTATEPVIINEIAFTKIAGNAVSSDFDSMKLYEGNIKIADSILDVSGKVIFQGLGLEIPAGKTKHIAITGDLSLNADLSHYIKIGIASADDIVTANEREVFGIFPLASNYKALVKPATISDSALLSLFDDILNHWVVQYAFDLYKKNIISGVRKANEILYESNREVTRAEALKMIMGAFSIAPLERVMSLSFFDLPFDSWKTKYVEAAFKKDIVSGQPCKDGLCFSPDTPITRAEALMMLFKAAEFTVDTALTHSIFTDVDPAAWYAPYISFAKKNGVVGGYPDGTFKPGKSLTRAEIAKVITVAMNLKETLK